MKKSKKFALLTGAVVGATAIAARIMKKKAEKTTYEADLIEPIEKRKMGFYEKYGKRILDIACATAAIVVFSPLYLGVAALVKLKLGSPVLFTQDRPGLIGKDGKETVFKMYKFRTMTDERDENGELLPDDVRLTKFGKWLRNTSLDELPEAFNILNGTMSVIGPRPQLVRDMTFMTKEQRARHTAKPGLSGLAQVNGRNGISWEEKLEWDRKYIQNVSFAGDVKIIVDTVKKAFIKQEGITQEDMATAEDFGDWLLRTEKVAEVEYEAKQKQAKSILNGSETLESENIKKVLVVASVVSFIEWFNKENLEYLKNNLNCEVHVACNFDYMDDTDETRTREYIAKLKKEGFILHNIHLTLKINWKYSDFSLYKDIFGFSIWVTISSLAQRLVFNITPSILGTVASSAAIALFGIVATIEGYTYTITTAINGMFMPKISRIYERGGEKDELMPLMLSVGKFQYAINGLIVAGFAVVGKEFINLWMGPTYLDAYYGILLVIIPGLFFNSMQIANTAMIVRKKVNLQAWVNLGMGMVNVLLSIILSSYFGVIGACISISIAYMLRAVVLLFIYKRVLKIDMASFVVNCYFRMGIPIIITIMLRFLMNSLLPNGGWLVLAAKGVVIVGIYAVVTLLLGLNSEERNKLLRRKV
ncbi:sugar transferase [Ruminococcus sp. RTP21359st1_H3_RTP21359_211015]|uniref:sugar transferase n=1 Tax=Ruminococcus sp. RTP21359st1_H3_RTP21359_211015 TaxID=3141606 RepID=UPI0034A3F8C0